MLAEEAKVHVAHGCRQEAYLAGNERLPAEPKHTGQDLADRKSVV